MNVLIIYFSQTGGTLKIAKMIEKGIINSGNDCELVNIIKEVDTKDLNDFDIIGLGSPTFLYREPINIRNYIKNMNKVDGKHCFIFSTHGSCIGNQFYFMSEGLKEKGYIIIGAYDSYSDSSIQFYPSPMHTSGHPDEKELEEARIFGEKICDLSLKIKNGELDLIPKFELITKTWWARDSNMFTLELLRKISPVFKINTELCTKCHFCQDNCPGDAIDVDADPPEIQKEGCIFCWFCEKACPEGAIEADWTFMKQSAKGNLKKYIKLLKKAEIEGKFRPYVNYEKIY
ncbi:MAG: EFR1 family ferrodoxin [Candidatus Helarchaeota archaeon]